MKTMKVLLMVFLVVFVVIATAGAENKPVLQWSRDKTGYWVKKPWTGKTEAACWRKTYTHFACPFWIFYPNGEVGLLQNGVDSPLYYGALKSDHIEIFETQGGMAGFPLQNVTRDPRGSEWWQEKLKSQKEKNPGEKVAMKEILGDLLDLGLDAYNQGLVDLVAKEIGSKEPTDIKRPRSDVLADIDKWDAKVRPATKTANKTK